MHTYISYVYVYIMYVHTVGVLYQYVRIYMKSHAIATTQVFYNTQLQVHGEVNLATMHVYSVIYDNVATYVCRLRLQLLFINFSKILSN